MDKGIVEGSEDASDAEDEFTCVITTVSHFVPLQSFNFACRTFSDLGTKGDVLGGGAFDLLLGRHLV
jgi:hypothetical protein